MEKLGRAIASLHLSLPPMEEPRGAARMARVLDINAAAFASTRLFDASEIRDLDRQCRMALDFVQPLLDLRGKAGFVRRGIPQRRACTHRVARAR